MSFESAGYQLLPVLPELVLAAGAMVLLMLGAYRGGEGTTRKRDCFGPVGANCSGSSGGSATRAHISQAARRAGVQV